MGHGSPAASTRLASQKFGVLGQVDDELGPMLGEGSVEVGRDADAVVVVPARDTSAADDVSRDEVVRKLLERSLDDRRAVIALHPPHGTVASGW